MAAPTNDPDGGIRRRSEDYEEALESGDFAEYDQRNADEGESRQ